MFCNYCGKERDYRELTDCVYFDESTEQYHEGHLCAECWEEIA